MKFSRVVVLGFEGVKLTLGMLTYVMGTGKDVFFWYKDNLGRMGG